MIDDLEMRVGAGYRRWRDRAGLESMVLGAVIVGLTFPAFFLIYRLLPQSPASELPVRLAIGGCAVGVLLVLLLVPRLRSKAYAMHPLLGVPLFVGSSILLVDAHFDPLYVSGMMLVIFGVSLFYFEVWHLGLVYASGFAATLAYALTRGRMGDPTVFVNLADFACGYAIAFFIGAIHIRGRRSEIESRARSEVLQERQISLLRLRDQLTGLPNLEQFTEAVGDAIALAELRGRSFAVLKVDLDHFARLIEQYGNRAADRILQVTARRLSGVGPELQVARGRGDTFLVLAAWTETREQADRVATRLLEAISTPYAEIAPDVYVSATVGLGLYPHDGRTVEELLAGCEAALARTKRRSRGTAGFFSDEYDEQLARARQIQEDLRSAIARREFVLYYQPCVSADGRPVSVEALLRWQHPRLGLLGPRDFIEIAEADDLIIPIGDWVMRQAAISATAWRAAGREITVAFNVSPRQFRDVALLERVRSAIADAGADPAWLTLELTESTAMHSAESAQRVLDECSALGLTIALDDFGTGYSSLSYLKHLPIDVIKVDQSFTASVPDDEDGSAIVRSIIALGHSIGCIVHAEGVETAVQAAWLRSAGCDRMQGYVFARPLPPEELERWLDATEASLRPLS